MSEKLMQGKVKTSSVANKRKQLFDICPTRPYITMWEVELQAKFSANKWQV